MRQVNDVAIPRTYGIYKYLDGNIIDTRTNIIVPEIDGRVHLPGTVYEDAIDSSINRLWHAAIMPNCLPDSYQKYVIVKRVSDGGNPFKDILSFYQLSHPLLPGLRFIPDHSIYVISHEGKCIINVKTGQHLNPTMTEYGYMEVRITRDCGKSIAIHVHRLVAMSWCKYDETTCNFGVDHADGVKDNNHHLNLELVSSSINTARASMHGNYGKRNVEVCLVDLDDIYPTVIKYESVAVLCNEMGFGKPSIHTHLNKLESNRSFKSRWAIWYSNMTAPNLIECKKNRYNGSQTRAIMATNILTGEIIAYTQAKDVLSAYVGLITKKQLEKTLKRNDRRLFGDWHFEYFN